MKNVKILIGLLVFASFQSCSDFLSEVPDSRTQLDSPEKISEILVNAYPSTSYMYFTEMLTDNVSDSKRVENTEIDNTTYFKFEDYEKDDWDSPTWYWNYNYSAISHANQALDAIEKLGNPSNLNPQRGEALLARAYSHFMLLSIFSNTYDPETADVELGVPYMKEVEVNLLVNYERNTIEETMQFIEEDIEEGITLVGSNYKQPKFHFTQNAAKAFATKFYAYKGDWDKVLEYSDELGDKPINKLRDLRQYASLSFFDQMDRYASKEENTNLLIATGASLHARKINAIRYGTVTSVTNIFYDNNPFGSDKSWANIYVARGQDVFYPTKFNEFFKVTNASAGIGMPYCTFVLLSNDDMYLHRIEAVVMKNQLDRAAQMLGFFAMHKTTGATEADLSNITVNTFINTYINSDEYDPFYTLTSHQKPFIKAIAEFRRREFSWEGARFFDIKRYNLEVVHNMTIEGQIFKLEKKDPRKAVQLPFTVEEFGVELNVR